VKTLSAVDEDSFSLDTSVAPTPGSTDEVDDYFLYPARHFVTPKERTLEACTAIEEEMHVQTKKLRQELNFEAAERLRQRVSNDLLLLRETGSCPGVENYSRHFAGRPPNVPPETLLDYLKLSGKEGTENPVGSKDWLLVVDESHVTLPQLKAMYGGDRARKVSLVNVRWSGERNDKRHRVIVTTSSRLAQRLTYHLASHVAERIPLAVGV